MTPPMSQNRVVISGTCAPCSSIEFESRKRARPALALAAENTTGARARRMIRFPDERAVHKYFVNASWQGQRIGEGGMVDYRLRIKENQIGEGTLTHNAPVLPAKALSGKRGHLTNCLRQAEPVALAGVQAENA